MRLDKNSVKKLMRTEEHGKILYTTKIIQVKINDVARKI